MPHLLLLMPEVAGRLGPETVMDTTVHPPRVSRLHYEVEGWLGDDLVESFPCHLVSPALAAELGAAGLTGFQVADAEVTLAPGVEQHVDPRIREFCWLQVVGRPGVHDLAVDDLARLVVGDRALQVLNAFRLDHCDRAPYAPD